MGDNRIRMNHIIRLTDLEAQFITYDDAVWKNSLSVVDASGVMFICPRCFIDNDGSIGTHSIICWFADRGVPPEQDPKPGRWRPGASSSIGDLTFVGPDAVSIQIIGSCNAHFFVRNGQVEW